MRAGGVEVGRPVEYDPLRSPTHRNPFRHNGRRLAQFDKAFPTSLNQTFPPFLNRMALKRQPSSAQAAPRATAMRDPEAGHQ